MGFRLPLKLVRSLSRFHLVLLITAVSIVGVIAYAFGVSGERKGLLSNLAAEGFGVGVGLLIAYLVIERKLREERRARFKAVEHDVLDGVLAHTIAAVRQIGMFLGISNLAPRVDEQEPDMVAMAEQFAKKVVADGVSLPPRAVLVIREFYVQADNVLNAVFELQNSYPFVFEEYPEIGKRLIDLRVRRDAPKASLYWYVPEIPAVNDERKVVVEQRLRSLVATCDELAEILLRRLESLRS